MENHSFIDTIFCDIPIHKRTRFIFGRFWTHLNQGDRVNKRRSKKISSQCFEDGPSLHHCSEMPLVPKPQCGHAGAASHPHPHPFGLHGGYLSSLSTAISPPLPYGKFWIKEMFFSQHLNDDKAARMTCTAFQGYIASDENFMTDLTLIHQWGNI